MKIRNLTPHDVEILDSNKNTVRTIKKENCNTPRLVEDCKVIDKIDDIIIKSKSYSKCIDLPEQVEGVYLIVSGLIASAMKRDDLLIPNTVRDEGGRIIGCDSFSQII